MTQLLLPGEMPDVAALCASLYTGMVIGMLYDVFRLLRLPFEGQLATVLLDTLYCALAFAAAAMGIYCINCGVMRAYIFAAMGTGIYLYLRYPSRMIVKLLGILKKRVVNRRSL